jgi:hypothetical protein
MAIHPQHAVRLVVAAAIAMCTAAGNPRAAQPGAPQQPVPLFAAAESGAEPEREARQPGVLRARRAATHAGEWPATVLLNVFDDAAYTAVMDRREQAPRGVTWVGHVPGRPGSTVTLIRVGDSVAGSIIMPGAVYSIRTVQPGIQEISEVDQSRLPSEAEPRAAPSSVRPSAATEADAAPALDGPPIIDLMVLYTPAARVAAGGAEGIAARIGLGVSETNTSYLNSNVTQRVRLVHSQEVSYTEHSDLDVDLSNLTNHDGSNPLITPIGNTAAILRDVYGADLVVLVAAPASRLYCGIAWLMDTVGSEFERFGFSVVDEGCLSPTSTLAHELGHNMGARHDWYADNGTAPHTYAHGYVDTVARWRTVMAYNSLCADQSFSCTRLLYWSNPAVLYGGAPMGIPGGTRSNCPAGNIQNVSCDADDHRTLNETAATVASFRLFPRRAVSDFTRDFQSDLLWRHAASGAIYLWPMSGNVPQPESYVGQVGTDWQIRAVADFTGDGTADLLWRQTTTGAMYLWPMEAGVPQPEEYVATIPPAYEIVVAGDFDHDGKADLLWRHVTQGDMWLWRMDGSQQLGEEYVDTVAPAYAVRGVGDLDGNGTADLLWQHTTGGDVWAWLMTGPVHQVAYVATVWDPGYQVKATGDFTGDGKADIVWHHVTQGAVYLWTMNGAQREAETWVTTVWDVNYQVAAAGDYDGNTRMDLIWRHVTNGDTWLWKMNGADRESETPLGTIPIGYQIVR